ncbi:MAG: glycosyltransferase family 4 protein [Erysipelotrichaceae bacterium]
MKICFIVHDMTVNGGVQRVLHRIASGLSLKNEVHICTFMNDGVEPYYTYNSKIHFEYLGNYYYKKDVYSRIVRFLCRRFGIVFSDKRVIQAFYDDKNVSKLREVLKKNKYDAVVAVQGGTAILLSQIAKTTSGDTRYYGWVHNTFQAYFKTPNAYNYGELGIAKKYLHYLDGVVTLTDKDVPIYQEVFNVKTQRIYNPLSYDSTLISNVENKHLIFVGRMNKSKGVDFLLEILRRVFNDPASEGWDCFIAGDGPELPFAKDKAKEYGIIKQLHFLGNRDDVENLYAMSSIMLSTSRFEGFGLVITEAYASGLPVVSFRNDGPEEIIRDGVDGILIEKYDMNAFANAILKLINNLSLRKQYSQCALERAQNFKIEKIIDEWEKMLKNEEN